MKGENKTLKLPSVRTVFLGKIQHCSYFSFKMYLLIDVVQIFDRFNICSFHRSEAIHVFV